MRTTILIGLITLFFIQAGYSQKLFIYGGKGEKIYLQEVDSLIQIKFRKDASLDEQQKIVKSIDPETKFSESKSKHLIIPIKKGILTDYVNLNKEGSVIYANKSLTSADGILQFPTEKVLVKIKASIQVEDILHSLNIDYKSVSRLGSDKNSFLIELGNGESILIANQLYESGYFEYAQPSFTRLIKMQNEFYPNQWGLNNTGQNGGTAGIDINAPEAWTLTRGCNNIRVAVIDQGVDLDHPDLAANLLPGFDATDGGDGGINGDCWESDAHGTCCAGIIGAVNNTIGTIGVAHNCRIIPIRVSYTRNNIQIWDDDWMVNAINHAWNDDDADVLSCSWGGGTAVAAVNTEITAALNQGRNTRGCIVVFSTGNNNTTIAWPANSNTDIIAVGAVSPCGERKSPNSCDNEDWYRPYPYNDYLGGSNYGNELDVVAPGVFVPTSDIQGSAGYNTTSGTGGNYYQTFNGTSSATPHVAGVAALILSINSGLTQNQVRDIIESTCTKVGSYTYSTVSGRTNGTWNNQTGYGCINAFAAVQRAAGGPITGPSTLCSTGASYSLPFLNGLSVSWNRSTNINMVSQQGSNPCTFSTNGNGNGWIEAVISTTCNNTVTLPRQTVWVGPPTAPSDIFGIQNGWEFWSETNYDFTVNSAYVQNANQYNWVVRGGTIFAGQGTPTITYKTARVPAGAQKTFDVSVKVGNTCGWGPYLMRSGYVNPPPGSSVFIVYPNPATTEVTVSVADNATAEVSAASATENVEINALEIIDMYGNHLKTEKYGKGQLSARVNVSGFIKGTYWLVVNKGGTSEEKHTLIVE